MSGERNKACKTHEASGWNKYRSSRNAAITAMRDAKKNCRTKFRDPKINPKQAWKTINDILGRNNNKNTIYEVKPSEKSTACTEKLTELVNEYLTNIDPKLARKIENESDCKFEEFITKRASLNKFSFEAVNESMVYRLITKLPISKSVRLGNIYTKVLQIAASAVVQPLTIFQQVN